MTPRRRPRMKPTKAWALVTARHRWPLLVVFSRISANELRKRDGKVTIARVLITELSKRGRK